MPTTNFTALGWSIYTVPNRVTSLTVSVDGAGSGSRGGGRVTGRLAVKAGQKLYCYCGTAGKAPSSTTGGAAANGGGAAGGSGRSSLGGYSGGGFSEIRLGSTSGSIKVVAGGAGGNSGDGGLGGLGGGSTGGNGSKAGTTDQTGIATGGTQVQGGNGGTSPKGSGWNGANAADTVVTWGGKGGTPPSGNGYGGGGGGGGYHSGGGGQASSQGYSPGGGGAGGSNYWLGLTGAAQYQGSGGAGNGSVSISWVTPPPGNIPPTVPSDPKVNNVAAESGMLTKATTSVKISANIFDPDKQNVRMLVRWSTASNFSSYKQGFTGWTTWHKDGRVVTYTMTGLAQNTHYYVRLYAQDSKGMYSTGYNSIDFWTNKAPLPPTDLRINGQGEGMMLPVLSSGTFGWTHNDEDYADYQSGFQIAYRVMATASKPAGAWAYVTQYPGTGVNLSPKVPGPPSSSHNEWVFNPQTFQGNTFYEWMVKTRDGQALWGAWSAPFSFYSESTSTPPILVTPANNGAVNTEVATTFRWTFIDPDAGAVQAKADIRWRALGRTKDVTAGIAPPQTTDDNWIMLLGAIAPGVPGAAKEWVVQDHTFVPEYTYEWQVRTYDNAVALASGWSTSYKFHAIATPGAQGGTLPFAGVGKPQGSLGCGTYRVFLYEQGGQKLLGEVTPMVKLNFTRVRDDISSCTVLSNGYSSDCGSLYAATRSWMHELVVYRDGVRVWEGPITRIAYTTDSVEIEAKDVMAYVYRRIMRAGYNDSYRLISKGTAGQPDTYLGLLSVVRRAALLVTQALAPFDPNVLPYLTALEFPDDAKESRIVADWSRTCWEEVDDLAATAGLDYTTVGRRIILWDTHRPVGRLPEMRDGDFSDSPIVTEYGMQLATMFAVTNGSGVVGWHSPSQGMIPYGPIEQLASSYSDGEGANGEVMTPAQKAAAEAALIDQAKRNISGRWPAPLVVRVPDNTTLSPTANIGFQQLIPGVWLPLRSVNTPRQVSQWQKLDSVGVDVEDRR